MRKFIKIRITEYETIENILQISKIYYLNIPIDKRLVIFNQIIFQRKMNSEDKVTGIGNHFDLMKSHNMYKRYVDNQFLVRAIDNI